MSDDGPTSDEDASETTDRPRTEDTMTDTVDDDGSEHREAETTQRDDEGRDLRRTLNYVLLAGLSLLALIATLQLYLNVSAAINQWISHEYRSLFQAAFNLVVLLVVGAGMVWQVRRIRK